MRQPLSRKPITGRRITGHDAAPRVALDLRLIVAIAIIVTLSLALIVLLDPSVQRWLAFDVLVVGRWWLVVTTLGLLVAPGTRSFTQHLPDRGLALNRMVGLVAVTYVAWLFGSLHLLSYTNTWPWLWMAIVGVVSVISAYVMRTPLPSLTTSGISRWLKGEAIFAALVLVYVLIEIHNPRTPLHNGDQGLDSALVNAIGRSDWFPPYDPWLSGWQLNYYYFGYLGQSILTRLTEVTPSVAYSLGMVTIIASTTSICLSTGWALTRRWLGGVVAALLVGLAHNLDLIRQIVELGRFDGLDWVHSTNLVEQTLSDPPFVVFSLGELHPQYLVLAMLALSCSVVFAVLSSMVDERRPTQLIASSIVAGLVIGMTALTNLYSMPEAFGLWIVMICLVWLPRRVRMLLVAGLVGLVVAVLGYLPFYFTFVGNQEARVIWNDVPTTPLAIALLFGMFILPLGLWALVGNDDAKRAKPFNTWKIPTTTHWFVAVVLVMTVVAMLAQVPRSGLVIYFAGFVIAVERASDAARRRADVAELFAWAAAVVTFGGLAGTEVVSIDVPTTTVAMRFNIAWKTYLSIWIPGSLAAAVAIGRLSRSTDERRLMSARYLALVASIIVIVLGVMAGFFYADGALNGLQEKPGLDGLVFVESELPAVQDDFNAISWLNQHARNSDVVLEATGGPAYPYARVSSFTGLATVLGWEHAVVAWHGPLPTTKERLADVEAIYEGTDSRKTVALLDKYGVRYIVVGSLEHSVYHSIDQDGLRRLAPVVFRQGDTEVLAYR
jgi:YYY domain-containing protein